MDFAINEILEELKTWDGYKIYSISYTNDERSKKEIDRCNRLYSDENFNECIIFESSFHTPKNYKGGLNPDTDYSGYTWFLAKSGGGQWKLITWGYC